VIWRALVFLDALTLASYAADKWGDHAAWATLAGLLALLLPLSKIEKALTKQTDLLTKILKGYCR
jgi:hypothetical protein